MKTAEQHQTTDLRVIVWGAVVLIIAGMLLITGISIYVQDNAAPVAAVASMVTMGAAGIFGLWKLNENMQAKVEAGTQRTEKAVADESQKITHRLNGELDQRIKEAVWAALEEFTARKV